MTTEIQLRCCEIVKSMFIHSNVTGLGGTFQGTFQKPLENNFCVWTETSNY